MSETYRKATDAELEGYGIVVNKKYRDLINTIDAVYPGAYKVVITFTSEYDDNYYQNSPKYYTVLDKEGNEIGLKNQHIKRRAQILEMMEKMFPSSYDNREPQEDVTINLAYPELYVKVVK